MSPGANRRLPDTPELLLIPPGRFTMGTSEGEVRRLGIARSNRILPWQQPAHVVTITHAFRLAAHPVTRAQYRRFAEEVGSSIAGDGWLAPAIRQADDHPVVRVSWMHARAYCSWLGDRTAQTCRLPAEAEWEFAARAGTTTAWWWGDDAGGGHAVCDDCGSAWDGKGTAPVASFPPNPFGLHDMLGQVFEWTADSWNPSYDGAPADGSAWLTGECHLHPTRGGSWNLDARYSRAGSRGRDASTYEGDMVGFRVAADAGRLTYTVDS